LFFIATDGSDDERYGVCSNYLEGLEQNEEILIFVRSAPGFHLPKDTTQPIILIGPGKFQHGVN
jgi:nitric-oxide synthase